MVKAIDFIIENTSKDPQPVNFLSAAKEIIGDINWGNPKEINIETHTIYTSYFEVLKQIEAKELIIGGIRIVLKSIDSSKSRDVAIKEFHETKVKFNGSPIREETIQSGCSISATVSDLYFNYTITKTDSIDFLMPAKSVFHITVFAKDF